MDYASGDVIFTSEQCDKALFGLQIVAGDETRYRQCGPSGRVWIVPCPPGMTFDAEDKVCRDRTPEVRLTKKLRKTTQAPKVKDRPSTLTAAATATVTTPKQVEEFVFSTRKPRPKSPKGGATKKNPIEPPREHRWRTNPPAPSPTPITRLPMRITTARPMPKSTKILPSTLQPDYTVKYNGQVISEKEFLQKLIKVIKEQKEMKKKEDDEEKRKELQRFRVIQAIERAREIEKIKDKADKEKTEKEKKRKILEEKVKNKKVLDKQSKIKEEFNHHQRLVDEERRELIESQIQAQKLAQNQIQEAQRKAAEEQRQKELLLVEEMRRRQHEAAMRARQEAERLLQAQRELEQRQKEEQERRKLEAQIREREAIEREKANMQRMILLERERTQYSRYATTPMSYIYPNHEPDQIIRFTTTTEVPWITSDGSWNPPSDWQRVDSSELEIPQQVVDEPDLPMVLSGCHLRADCPLSYEHDTLCEHPFDNSLYLQCSPLLGRKGRWVTRECPTTLVFLPDLARCDIPRQTKTGEALIPKLPSENYIQWKGNGIIESNPPVQKIPLIYPPTTPHPSPIYNTIDTFPRDLLPNFGPPTIKPQPINTDYLDVDFSMIHPLFPRVQPNFLTNAGNPVGSPFRDSDNVTTIGEIVKPMIKSVALKHTNMFLDRILSDDARKGRP
ncbi:hypothetical protein WR25_04113 [Diploscapter pachys]|uniref:Chitin-binding type-2 domain-containing protein n=1 Tax=Diploscapter pachys TaxID=2018661 RepID=A0A2A2J2C9_9BILA|nr:hypothetical protein WR25_04113 [Diploscapter pachys]